MADLRAPATGLGPAAACLSTSLALVLCLSQQVVTVVSLCGRIVQSDSLPGVVVGSASSAVPRASHDVPHHGLALRPGRGLRSMRFREALGDRQAREAKRTKPAEWSSAPGSERIEAGAVRAAAVQFSNLQRAWGRRDCSGFAVEVQDAMPVRADGGF